MLPPPVLSSLSLQPDCPSEVVTVGARIDASSGELLGARIFRSVLPRTTTLSYPAADDVLQNAHPREPLPLIADLLDKWHRRRIKASEATKKRDDRLDRKASEGFERTPAHRLVDHSLGETRAPPANAAHA
jgi:exoribonuclease R